MSAPIHLKGQSGARLRVLTKNGKAIVRKSSPDGQSDSRLLRQMEKQRAFNALGGQVKAPEILDSGTDEEGRFYFDMEFIAGLDGHLFLEKCSPAELRDFARKLSDHLLTINHLPSIGLPSIYKSLFEASVYKLIQIHQQHVGLSNEQAGLILDQLERVRNLEIKSQGFCHGDFTLENIMVDTRGNLVFVDFLDSAFEHPLQDIVKLSQDIHGGWFRTKGRRISGAYISYLDEMLGVAVKNSFPCYKPVRNVLQALNFCRILPYITNEYQQIFVIDQINKFSA